MHTYESLKHIWEEAADLRSLFTALPEIFRFETQENQKEHYQELQELLGEVAGQVAKWDFSDPERASDLTGYLLMLAESIPEIDEEVFDHKMNLVREYRKTLKAFLAVYPALDGDSGQRLCESIRLACEHKVLLREKYEAYLEGGRHAI